MLLVIYFECGMTVSRATLKTHIVLANWKNPSCESANSALSAARAILRYVNGLTSSSWDLMRLDKTACVSITRIPTNDMANQLAGFVRYAGLLRADCFWLL